MRRSPLLFERSGPAHGRRCLGPAGFPPARPRTPPGPHPFDADANAAECRRSDAALNRFALGMLSVVLIAWAVGEQMGWLA